MSSIKKHQCPSCGGTLSVDNERQMYRCTFCGSTYDYEYFREEQMHDLGETYLSRGEFMAAADAYRFILKKDPHDFMALRGLMLAATRLKSIDELERDNESTKFTYNDKLANEAIENASDEDKEYFNEFARICSDKKKLAAIYKEIENLKEKKRKISADVMRGNIIREDYYVENARDGTKFHPKVSFVIGWAVAGFFALFSIYCISIIIRLGADSVNSVIGVLIFNMLSMAGITAINLFVTLPKMRKINDVDLQIGELYAESGRAGDRIRDLENDAEKLLIKIKNSSHDFVRRDRQIIQEIKG